MIIVDSSVWIDYLNDTVNPHTEWLEHAIGSEPIALTSLILCEVLQGVRQDRAFVKAEEQLLSLPVFDMVKTKLAIEAARNYRVLRKRGITIRKSIDCLIATFCITEGYRLLHRDRDFVPFERHLGLAVVQASALPLT